MAATSGVLPVPPTLRFPILMTGRSSRLCAEGWATYHRLLASAIEPYMLLNRRKNGDGTPLSGRRSEWPQNTSIAATRGEEIGNHRQRSIPRPAIGFDERTRGGSETCSSDRVRQ